MAQISIFGIKTVKLNGFNVYTLKVRVKHNPFNSQFITNNAKSLSVKYLNDCIELSYTTMNKQIFNQAVETTRIILKEISLNNVNDKYQWKFKL